MLIVVKKLAIDLNFKEKESQLNYLIKKVLYEYK